MDPDLKCNRNERRQRYKGKQNFKNQLRIEYIKDKKKMQQENQKRARSKRGKKKKFQESSEEWDSSPEKNWIQSTRCKIAFQINLQKN